MRAYRHGDPKPPGAARLQVLRERRAAVMQFWNAVALQRFCDDLRMQLLPPPAIDIEWPSPPPMQ